MYCKISFEFCFLFLKFYNFTMYNIQIFLCCLKFGLTRSLIRYWVEFRLKEMTRLKNQARFGFDPPGLTYPLNTPTTWYEQVCQKPDIEDDFHLTKNDLP